MRKSITLSAIVVSLLAAVLTTGPVAQAMPPTIPPEVQAGCGAESGNYAACVTIVNATRGFTAPGQVNASAGLAFYGRFSVWGQSSGRSESFALGSANQPTRAQLQAGNGWVAYNCRVAWPNLHGCGTQVITQLESAGDPQVTSANRLLQLDVVQSDPNPTNTARGEVRYRSNITDDRWTCADASRYVACEKAGQWQGSRRWARFNYRLVNKTVAIRLTNNLPQRLELRESQWGQTIPDRRGETPATTLASGQRNSARSVAPDVEGFAVPQVWWGGIRPVSRANTNVSLTYDVTGAGQYQGVQIHVDLRFDSDGNVRTDGACRATGRTSNVPFCEVSASSSGGATQLNVSLRAF